MTWKHVRRPDSHAVSGAVVPLAALLVALALATLGFQAFLHVHVTVDGESVRVPTGSTVADLLASGDVDVRAGDLVALDGKIARKGGGEAASAWIGGSRAASDTVLSGGERIETRAGRDCTETIVRAERVIPIPVTITGTGSIIRMATTGSPGAVVLRAGEISGQVVATEAILPPTPMTLVRTTPKPAGGAKLVALTFDDGPWPKYTEQILRILRERNVKATFFAVGGRLSKQPDTAKKIVAEGHVLANHTLSHQKLDGATTKVVRRQIRQGGDRIKKVAMKRPAWFRPPGGHIDSTVIAEARKANQQIVLWSVDPQDWRRPGWKKIAARVVNATRPGDVILLHDGGGDRGQTVQALPRIIRQLEAKGYTFVTLDELAAADITPVSRLGQRR